MGLTFTFASLEFHDRIQAPEIPNQVVRQTGLLNTVAMIDSMKT